MHSVQLLTSSAAEDLHTQVEGVSELHRDDAQVARFDQPTEPAGHRGSAYHSQLKHLRHNQQDTINVLDFYLSRICVKNKTLIESDSKCLDYYKYLRRATRLSILSVVCEEAAV